MKQVCTHNQPNGYQIVDGSYNFNFAGKTSKLLINMEEGYKLSAKKCSSDGKCAEMQGGTWSTIYDQSLRVLLDDGTRFTTNFRYNVKPDITKNSLAVKSWSSAV